MRLVLVIVALLVLALPARAVDPECVDMTPADPTKRYNARQGVKVCAPVKDVNGGDLTFDELTNCTLVIATSPTAKLEAVLPAEPGELLIFSMPAGIPKVSNHHAYCSGPEGRSPDTPVYEVFVPKPPGQPWWWVLRP